MAVGFLALCEIALITLAGIDRPHPSNQVHHRAAGGFTEPPPCSVVDRRWVTEALDNPDVTSSEQNGTNGYDSVRECGFSTPGGYSNNTAINVTITCVLDAPHGRPDNPAVRGDPGGPLDPTLGATFPNGATIHDNWSDDASTPAHKRYTNDVDIGFVIDNLFVKVNYEVRMVVPMSALPGIRQQTISVAAHVAAQLS
jgi:hypothetical protein